MVSFVEWFNSNKIWYLWNDSNSAVINTWNSWWIDIDFLWYKSKILFNWTILINVSIVCHHSVYAGFFLDTILNINTLLWFVVCCVVNLHIYLNCIKSIVSCNVLVKIVHCFGFLENSWFPREFVWYLVSGEDTVRQFSIWHSVALWTFKSIVSCKIPHLPATSWYRLLIASVSSRIRGVLVVGRGYVNSPLHISQQHSHTFSD